MMNKYTVTLKPGLGGLLKAIENYTIQSGTHDFLLTFHSNHRPILYCFQDKQRYLSKVSNFPTPRVFNATDEGFPLEFGIGTRGPECFYDGAARWSKKF